jgi:hypothetical protein
MVDIIVIERTGDGHALLILRVVVASLVDHRSFFRSRH